MGDQIIDAPGDLLRRSPEIDSDYRPLEAGSVPLAGAASLLRQGFIRSEVSFPAAFEDWRAIREQSLRRDIRSRALRVWTTGSATGNWEDAAEAAEALHILDEDDPTGIERVIEARAHLGEVVAAEAAYAVYLGSLPGAKVPSPEVVAIMDRVRTAHRSQCSDDRGGECSVPFVGRKDVLKTAHGFIDSLRMGHFGSLFVSGESGIGKTRLLDELQREALLRGFRCLRAQPVELEQTIPLNPLVDVLCQVDDLEECLESVGRPWSAVVGSLLPPGRLRRRPESPPPIQAISLSRRLLDSFLLVFQRLAQDQPTLLLLDDLHWADATTITAVQFLRRRWMTGALGMVATFRPDLVEATDPMAAFLAQDEEPQARRVGLTPMEDNEALALVRAIAGPSIGDSHASQLCAIAGCHPLYLTELTRDFMVDRLALPLHRSDEIEIPRSLGKMLDARLTAMDSRTRVVAGILAVAAKPLKIATIQTLTHLSPADTAGAVDALIRARFAREEGNRVGLAHDLFRSAVYRHLSSPRRAVHHRAIADHLLLQGSEDSAGELSVHFARAGDGPSAARHGWIAAKRALDAGAIAEAIHFLNVVKENETDRPKRANAVAALARALYLSRDITRANPELLVAAEELRATGRPGRARRLEILRVGGLAEVGAARVEDLVEMLRSTKDEATRAEDWEGVALALDAELQLLHRAGDADAILTLFREMRFIAGKDSREAQLLSRTGLALSVFFEDPEEALRAAREGVALADGGSEYRLQALNRLLIVLQARGLMMTAEATTRIQEARALAEQSGDPLAHFSVESNIAVASLDAGDVDRAEALLERANAVANVGQMQINRFIQANNEAELAMARRDYPAAARRFSRAASFLGRTTPTYMQDLVNAGLGHCALETGDLSEARRREGLLHPPPTTWYFDPTTILAFRSRLLERRGDIHAAIRLLADCAENLEGRLTLAWMKIVLLQVRLTAKDAPRKARDLADHMACHARELNLTRRAREFEVLAGR